MRILGKKANADLEDGEKKSQIRKVPWPDSALQVTGTVSIKSYRRKMGTFARLKVS